MPDDGEIKLGRFGLVMFGLATMVSIIVVGLRFLGRHFRRRIGLDDWFMLLTLILNICFVALISKAAVLANFHHSKDLEPERRDRVVKLVWFCQPFIVVGFATGKLSVGILLWRVFEKTSFWRKWSLVFAVASALVSSVVEVGIAFGQCSPVEAVWYRWMVDEGKATCWPAGIQFGFALFLS
ncbi:hypothetical protein E4U41_001684, partial [Claviceps citrina]